MAGLKLYELAQDYREVEDRLMAAIEAEQAGDSEAGEMAQIWRDTLEGLQGSLADKISNIVKLIREKKAEAEAIKSERQRLEKRQRAAEGAEERLRDYVAWAMGASGLERVKNDVATVTLADGRPKLVVQDFERFKEWNRLGAFWKPEGEKTEADIDKAKLKELMADGLTPDGVAMVTEKVLTIR